MSEYNNEYDDYYYDDGRFADEGQQGNEYDSYNIPTYDELDIEGRYYEYGSREDYNNWRNEQIRNIRNSNLAQRRNHYSYTTNSDSGCMSVICLIIIFIIFWIIDSIL